MYQTARTILILSILFVIPLRLAAEEKTVENIFQDSDISWYAGGIMEIGAIAEDMTFSLGTTGAAVVNADGYSVAMGIYFLGVDNDPEITFNDTTTNADVSNWGLSLAYTHRPANLLHWRLGCRFGWSQIEPNDETTQHSLVLTPHVDAEVNITEELKASVGAGFRMFTFINDEKYDRSEFSKPMAHLSVVWHF